MISVFLQLTMDAIGQNMSFFVIGKLPEWAENRIFGVLRCGRIPAAVRETSVCGMQLHRTDIYE